VSAEKQSIGKKLAGEAAEKFLLVHAVLEGLMAIDEDYRDLVVELAAKFRVGVYVDFLPGEAAAAREFGETFLDHLAEVTSLARVNYDLTHEPHGWIVAFLEARIPAGNST
jgi:hypothetical protein